MPLPVDLTMHQINTWRDVLPFAGCIVAFKTNSAYLSSREHGFRLNDTSLEFGYVDTEVHSWNRQLGHRLYRLITSKDWTGACALTDSQINSTISILDSQPTTNLSMRLVSIDEINTIAEAVLEDQAVFENKDDKKKVLIFMSEYMGMLLKKSLLM